MDYEVGTSTYRSAVFFWKTQAMSDSPPPMECRIHDLDDPRARRSNLLAIATLKSSRPVVSIAMSDQIADDETTKDDRHQRLQRVMKGPDDPPEEDTVRLIREGMTERDARAEGYI